MVAFRAIVVPALVMMTSVAAMALEARQALLPTHDIDLKVCQQNGANPGGHCTSWEKNGQPLPIPTADDVAALVSQLGARYPENFVDILPGQEAVEIAYAQGPSTGIVLNIHGRAGSRLRWNPDELIEFVHQSLPACFDEYRNNPVPRQGRACNLGEDSGAFIEIYAKAGGPGYGT